MIKRSFPPVVDTQTRLLILGSLPGDASLAAQRYYAHPQNAFWRLLGAVLNMNLAALDYETRLTILRAHKIGLWDVVADARRTGSLDAAIRHATANDLPALIAGLPGLRAIAFNGQTAARLGRLALGDSPLALIDLPSSSPAYTLPLAEKAARWSVLAPILA
ncbi:DNA-deoxyinosine glycosylase [Sphingomonas antarctica]|uniref:DNA-deoxyinosine glycosylase n=1 Tax=Sphingomonas antarctica TaxID=2040274 RepID=UPI0039ED4054